MALTKNTDYYGQAIKRLIGRFKNKPRIYAIIASYAAEFQAVEDAMWDIFVARLMQNIPTGDLLLKLGELVGQPNLGGWNDGEYFLYIVARIATNRSDGRHETLINIVSLLTAGSFPITFRTYLKSLEIEVDNVIANSWVIYHDFLKRATVAGDKLWFFFSKDIKENVRKRTSVSGGVTTVSTQRKGSVSGTFAGGKFGGVYS